MIARIGCKLTIDDISCNCNEHRTKADNMKECWNSLRYIFGSKFMPKSKDEFLKRGGKIQWYSES